MQSSVHLGHTIARNRKAKTAPSARPRDRKKAMMDPAVSASAGCTFLKEGGKEGYLRMAPTPAPPRASGWGDLPEHPVLLTNASYPPNPNPGAVFLLT